jgi:predicted HTH domain antitoxin
MVSRLSVYVDRRIRKERRRERKRKEREKGENIKVRIYKRERV